MTPISVSRRSITECLCRALNVPLSNNTWATLQQTTPPAQNCPGHQGNVQKPSVWEKQGSPDQADGAGQAWKDQIPLFPALIPAQHCPGGLIKGKLCSALRDPLWCSMEHVADLNRKETGASSTENGYRDETLRLEGECSKVCPTEKGSFHKQTQTFSEDLCRETPNPKHHKER